MPLYEYKCSDCDRQFEELVSSSDTKVKCTHCGSEKVSRLLSVFSASGGSTSSNTPCGAPSCSSGFS